MSDPILCPSCGKVAGFRSITKEKIKEIKIAIGEKYGNMELVTFGFCPCCGHPIKLEDFTLRDEKFAQWIPLKDGIHKETILVRHLEIKGLKGTVKSDDLLIGLYMILGKPISIRLTIDDRCLPQVHFNNNTPTCPAVEFEFDGTETVVVSYPIILKDEIVSRETGTYVWGVPIKIEEAE